LFENHLPRFYAAIERRIQQNATQKFLVGKKLTIADISLAGRTFGFAYNDKCPWKEPARKIFDANPGLKTWAKHMEEEFADYLKTRTQREW
jgi:glutathione S-transferase